MGVGLVPMSPHSIGLDLILTRLFRAAMRSMRRKCQVLGAVAQLGERLICIQEVAGSIPTSSTSLGL